MDEMRVGLILFVSFSLFCFVQCQSQSRYPFEAHLNGENQVPPVRTSRTATIRLSGVSGYAPVDYQIETDINDMTSLEFFGPAAPGLVGPSLASLANPPLTGSVTIPLAQGSPLNNPFLIYLLSNQLYVVIRTTRFPQGEVRGNIFVPDVSPTFVGATLFTTNSDAPPTPEINCFAGGCHWSTSLPPTRGTVQVQGPDGFLLSLQESNPFIIVPGYTSGEFTLPPPDFAKFLDYGVRGELRLVYLVDSKEFISTALSVASRTPTFRALLNGTNLNPAVRTSASGVCKIYTARGYLKFQVTQSVERGIRATVNSGGESGQLVFDLQPGAVQLVNNFKSATFAADPGLTYGVPNWFVKIASSTHQNGEIGGKVEVNPLEVFSDSLTPSKVNPPVSSSAFGEATLQYDDVLNRIFFYINATASGIKSVVLRGPASTRSTGRELAVLCSFKCNARLLFIGALNEGSSAFLNGETLSSVLSVLRQGSAYIEIQTNRFPQGELRANLPRARIERTQTTLLFRFPIDKFGSDSEPQPTPSVEPTKKPRRPRRSRVQVKHLE